MSYYGTLFYSSIFLAKKTSIYQNKYYKTEKQNPENKTNCSFFSSNNFFAFANGFFEHDNERTVRNGFVLCHRSDIFYPLINAFCVQIFEFA